MSHAYIVDIQSSQGFSLGLTLEKAGYTVTLADDYDAVMTRLKKSCGEETRPDILIVALDEMGEKEACLVEWLVKEDFDIPLLVVTNFASSSLLRDFADENHWYYLEKPFSPEQIISTVELAASRTRKN